MKTKKIITNLLLAFVMMSIGCAIGRELERNRSSGKLDTSWPVVAPGESKTIVYYLHGTFRCATCNKIESMGEELIRTEFTEALKAGQLEWKSVDYLQDERLADRYKVSRNMIVVSQFRDGKEVEVRRLDKVMDLVHDRAEFMNYVRGAVEELLEDKP